MESCYGSKYEARTAIGRHDMDYRAAVAEAKTKENTAARNLASLAAYGVTVERDHALAVTYRNAHARVNAVLTAWSELKPIPAN